MTTLTQNNVLARECTDSFNYPEVTLQPKINTDVETSIEDVIVHMHLEQFDTIKEDLTKDGRIGLAMVLSHLDWVLCNEQGYGSFDLACSFQDVDASEMRREIIFGFVKSMHFSRIEKALGDNFELFKEDLAYSV